MNNYLASLKASGRTFTVTEKNGKIDPIITTSKESSYLYDANGIRTTKHTYGEDLQETVSLTETDIANIIDDPNNESPLIEELQATINNNLSETNYYYLGDMVLFTSDYNGYKLIENVVDPWGNTIVSKRYEEEVITNNYGQEVVIGYEVAYYTFNTDIRGSTTSIIRPDGTIVTGYIYDEFGNQIKTKEADFINEATYTGAIHDSETNLTYLNARYYDSHSGRFISQDSYKGVISSPQTQHLYSYTSNNPINFIDPTGHKQMSNEGDGGSSKIISAGTSIGGSISDKVKNSENSRDASEELKLPPVEILQTLC